MKDTLTVIIATDSFKGSLTSIEAARTIERGILKADANALISIVPMADGGEGTVEALVTAMGGEFVQHEVIGPLGEIVTAAYGILEDGITGVIEVAAASGITLIPEDKRNPLKTTSYGTGELIIKALDKGCTKLIIGLGGSGTNDGGMGIAQALGVRFYDNKDGEFGLGGEQLQKIHKIDMSGYDRRLESTEITIICDVNNPLCGPNGASYIFGPQKGATLEMVEMLDRGLENYAAKIEEYLNRGICEIPGAGAAGGIGGGLCAFTKGKLKSGVQTIIQTTGLEEKVKNAHLVITGEGKTDKQTLYGKVPYGIGNVAKKYSIPVICLSGSLQEGYENLYEEGITGVFSIINKPMSLMEAMEQAESLLEQGAANLIRLFRAR
jgi:glycerate 2-kinase